MDPSTLCKTVLFNFPDTLSCFLLHQRLSFLVAFSGNSSIHCLPPFGDSCSLCSDSAQSFIQNHDCKCQVPHGNDKIDTFIPISALPSGLGYQIAYLITAFG